jgi:hypothetical protein
MLDVCKIGVVNRRKSEVIATRDSFVVQGFASGLVRVGSEEEVPALFALAVIMGTVPD